MTTLGKRQANVKCRRLFWLKIVIWHVSPWVHAGRVVYAYIVCLALFMANCGIFQSCAEAAQFAQHRISIPKPPCFAALAPWAACGPGAAVAACHSWQAALQRGCLFQHKICACPDCEALAGSRSWLHGGPTYAGDAGCATGYEPPATAACDLALPRQGWCHENELLACGLPWPSGGPHCRDQVLSLVFFFSPLLFFSSSPPWLSQQNDSNRRGRWVLGLMAELIQHSLCCWGIKQKRSFCHIAHHSTVHSFLKMALPLQIYVLISAGHPWVQHWLFMQLERLWKSS